MKRSLFAFALGLSVLGSTAQTSDPVLMKINGKEIKKSEFEYIYGKNNSSSSLDKKSLDEYMVLFRNFKLKVAEAESKGIDTTQAFINELAGYRKQLAQPYLTDKSADDRPLTEAYERMKQNIEVSHILLRLPEEPTSADTLDVYNKIMEIRKQLFTPAVLKKGKPAVKTAQILNKDLFAKIAAEKSEDPSAKDNKGYLGFISAFMTVTPFEVAAYQTSPNQVSMPVRTNFGYHLILVHSRRQDPGEVLVAHIMKSARPKNDSVPADIAEADAKKGIMELYDRVRKGADFGVVAMESSDDKGSAAKNGELPWFGANRMIKEFETTAFGLKEKGDISAPFKTRFGWHFIKLIDRKGIAPFEEKKAEIQQMLNRDPQQGDAGQQLLIAKLKKEYSLTEDAAALAEMVQLAQKGFPTDSLYQAEASKLNKPLLTLDGKKYVQKDFARFMAQQPAGTKKSASDFVNKSYPEFVNQSVIAYEDSRLESKYAEFRNLMQEYHDGMLLFEISNQEVWERASKDNEGLKDYFEKNRKNYAWSEPRYKGLVVYCNDAQTAKKARQIIKKTADDSVVFVLKKVLNDSITRVKVEKGIFAKTENKVIDGKIFKAKEFVPDSQFPQVFLSGKVLKKGPENYNDVRGLVTSDYQNYLEEQWLKKLNEKYKIEVNETVLKTVKP